MGVDEASMGHAGTARRAGNGPRRLAVIALLLAAGSLAGCTGGAASPPGPASVAAGANIGSGAGTWGTVQRFPSLTPRAQAGAYSVSCAPRGECTAIGALGPGGLSAITDRNGTWGTVTPIPAGVGDTVLPDTKVSCPAAGECTATGASVGSQLAVTIFVAEQANGTWGPATRLPGIPGNLTPGVPPTLTLTCAAPGDCAVAGTYTIAQGLTGKSEPPHAFVAEEVNGTWRQPADIPGLQALSRGSILGLTLLSCPSPGHCALAGDYSTPSVAGSTVNLPEHGYVASEVNGIWGTAIEVPGDAALATEAGSMSPSALSCSAPGDCVAVGSYTTSRALAAPSRAFIVTESGGTWSAAAALPGMRYLQVIDCPDAGDCVAGGTDAQGNAAIVQEAQRRWGDPAEIPGIQALAPPDEKGISAVNTLACPTAATCAVGGGYIEGAGGSQPGMPQSQVFLAGEVRGTWGTAGMPPGMATLGAGSTPVLVELACAAPGNCAAGGFYVTAQSATGAFITAEAPAK
jgi:hypothetical protein